MKGLKLGDYNVKKFYQCYYSMFMAIRSEKVVTKGHLYNYNF